MSWKTNRSIEKAREEEALMREFEFMKKYGVDISDVPFGMTTMLEAACHAAYSRGWADCKAKADVPDTNVGEWIPCIKELPDEEGMYLITARVYDKKEIQYAFYQKSIEMFICNGTAIAWQPLPEPYKESD